ncbi:MAG: quinol oxidase subunit [Candidatus Adlerbacteria bacterium]|nr:quinol oxidase subunit [Candidatus Adlerbacteria bacterium]
MHRWIDCYAPLFGRILMGGFFLWQGIQATLNFANTTLVFNNVLWVPADVAAVIVIAIEVGGGICLIVGSRVRLVAILLAMFMLLTSTFLLDYSYGPALALFMSNMAIAGGLLCIASAAPSSWKR